jgi:hypothetical protein
VIARNPRGRCGGAASQKGSARTRGPAAGEGVPLPVLSHDNLSDIDFALRNAALRLKHEQLVEAQADFLDDAAQRWRQVRRRPKADRNRRR